MSNWLNTTRPIRGLPKDFKRPCHLCGYCPYGQLVEEFPIKEPRGKMSCAVFGHDCPAYYHAEQMTEG